MALAIIYDYWLNKRYVLSGGKDYFATFSFLPSSVIPYFVCLLFRSIYDDQPNAHKRFMEKLDARIRNHDREIEKMCNFHHQGFVDAITELLKVRADAEKLMVRQQNNKSIRLLSSSSFFKLEYKTNICPKDT